MNHFKKPKNTNREWVERSEEGHTHGNPSEGLENGVGSGGGEEESREINVRGQGGGKAGVEA